MNKKQGGFADIITILIAGAIILGAGIILDAHNSLVQDELPDSFDYPISIYSEVQ